MTAFSDAVKARISEKGLNISDAAAAIGVALPGLRATLNGTSTPNSRSLSKYSAFLGKTDEETKALLGDAPRSKKSAPKKAGGKPGRPAKASAKGKRAKSTGPAPKSAKKGSFRLTEALSAVAGGLKKAEAILADDMAVAVHELKAPARKLLQGILKSIG